MNTAIRFTKVNRYGKPVGSIDQLMGYGVQHALVHRGIAEWVNQPIVATGISEPVAETTETTKRRQRRVETIEE